MAVSALQALPAWTSLEKHYQATKGAIAKRSV
jgi:hypothetical protein